MAILGSSGVSLAAGFADRKLNLKTNVGPLTVDVGKDAVLTGAVTSVNESAHALILDRDMVQAGIREGDVISNTTKGASCKVQAPQQGRAHDPDLHGTFA